MALTLKQAAAYLAASPTPYKLPTLRKAIQSGSLKSQLVETDVQEYRTVEESDLIAWATDQSKVKRGNPNIRNVRRKPVGRPTGKKASEQ